MPPDALALYAAVILLLPMGCFFLASPTFLLVKMEVPEVTQLLRAIVSGYYLAIGIAGTVAMVLLAAAGRTVIALGAIAIAIFAIAVRKWLLRTAIAKIAMAMAPRAMTVRPDAASSTIATVPAIPIAR